MHLRPVLGLQARAAKRISGLPAACDICAQARYAKGFADCLQHVTSVIGRHGYPLAELLVGLGSCVGRSVAGLGSHRITCQPLVAVVHEAPKCA